MVRNNFSLTVVCGWRPRMRRKSFHLFFQDCQIKRNVISSLIEVTIGNDVRELDVKICSQLNTVEMSRLFSRRAVKPNVWLLHISTVQLWLTMESFTWKRYFILFFLIQMLLRICKAVAESCFLWSMSSSSPINEFDYFFLLRHSSLFSFAVCR